MQQKDFKQVVDRSAAQKAAISLKKYSLSALKALNLRAYRKKRIQIKSGHIIYYRQVNDLPYTANGFSIGLTRKPGKLSIAI